MAQRNGAVESRAYGSCIHYWSETRINTRRLFFRMARSNPCARQENVYDKTNSKDHIFQKRQPKTLIFDNAPEFYDKDLHLWLKKIGCKPYKTLPYHPQSNGLVERMMQTVKTGLKACSQQKEKIEVFLPRLLLGYRTIPHAGRLRKPISFNGKAN